MLSVFVLLLFNSLPSSSSSLPFSSLFFFLTVLPLPLHHFILSHFFLSIHLCRFLTKREQQLMQRRHHAEELLQWKQQLDKEEAEVRRMEKEALAAWDQKTLRDNHLDVSEGQEKDISDISSHLSHRRSSEPRTDSEKGEAAEFSYFQV